MSRAAVVATVGLDNLRLRHVRFLHECSRLGEVTVLLWSDAAASAAYGTPPKFDLAERRSLLESLRSVYRALVSNDSREPWRGVKDIPASALVCFDPASPGTEMDAARRTVSAVRAPLRAFGIRSLRDFPPLHSLPGSHRSSAAT